jgi:hypothetical protein
MAKPFQVFYGSILIPVRCRSYSSGWIKERKLCEKVNRTPNNLVSAAIILDRSQKRLTQFLLLLAG